MTLEVCAEHCATDRSSPAEFFGVEAGTQCWCGHTVNSGTTELDPSACTLPCSGNSTEICGGSEIINIYELVTSQ